MNIMCRAEQQGVLDLTRGCHQRTENKRHHQGTSLKDVIRGRHRDISSRISPEYIKVGRLKGHHQVTSLEGFSRGRHLRVSVEDMTKRTSHQDITRSPSWSRGEGG